MKCRLVWLLLALAAVITSCEKEDQIVGFDVLPESDLLTTNVDSTSVAISFSTVFDDSVRSEYVTYMVGENEDPVFGRTRASYATRLYLQGMMGDLRGMSLDSVCFHLSKSSKYAYGDTTVAQTLSLYELTQDISVSQVANYCEKAEVPTCLSEMKKIMDLSFPAYADTNSSYEYKLDEAYSKNLYERMLQCYSVDTTLQYFDSTFIRLFKGICITTKDNKMNQCDAVVTHCVPELDMYLSGNDTTLKLVFAPSPQAYTSPLSSDPSQIYLQALNVFEHEYPTELSSSMEKESTMAYVQGMVGTKTSLTLSGLETWRDSLVAINIAKLYVPLQQRSSWSEYLPLNLRIYDSNRNMVYSTVSSTNDSTDFVFNVHGFLVHLFNNSAKSDTYSYEIVVPENNTYGNSFVLDGNQTDKLKLVITYSK